LRHSHIRQNEIDIVFLGKPERLLSVVRFADNPHSQFVPGNCQPESFADHRFVIHDDHLQFHRRSPNELVIFMISSSLEMKGRMKRAQAPSRLSTNHTPHCEPNSSLILSFTFFNACPSCSPSPPCRRAFIAAASTPDPLSD